MAKYLNNALASSMISDGTGLAPVATLSDGQAQDFLRGGFHHAGNQNHWPTWHAVAARLGVPGVKEAEGGRVLLQPGDELLVTEVAGLPRETREFTPEEIGAATIRFRLFKAV
jgi:hypothetical protein